MAASDYERAIEASMTPTAIGLVEQGLARSTALPVSGSNIVDLKGPSLFDAEAIHKVLLMQDGQSVIPAADLAVPAVVRGKDNVGELWVVAGTIGKQRHAWLVDPFFANQGVGLDYVPRIEPNGAANRATRVELPVPITASVLYGDDFLALTNQEQPTGNQMLHVITPQERPQHHGWRNTWLGRLASRAWGN